MSTTIGSRAHTAVAPLVLHSTVLLLVLFYRSCYAFVLVILALSLSLLVTVGDVATASVDKRRPSLKKAEDRVESHRTKRSKIRERNRRTRGREDWKAPEDQGTKMDQGPWDQTQPGGDPGPVGSGFTQETLPVGHRWTERVTAGYRDSGHQDAVEGLLTPTDLTKMNTCW